VRATTARRRAALVAQHRVELDRRIQRGDSFEEIEDWIDGLPLPSDPKAALWLWLWAHQPRADQRQVALEGLRTTGLLSS
jgi:hypothetical protein